MKKFKIKSKISINPVLMMVVSLTAFLTMIICVLLMYVRFNNIVTESAKTTSSQAVSNISRSVDTFVETMVEQLENIEEIVLGNVDDEEQMMRELETLFNLRGDLVDIVIYDENGRIMHYVAEDKAVLKSNAESVNISFNGDVFTGKQDYYISEPHVNNLFEKEYPWVVTVSSAVSTAKNGKMCVSMDVEFDGVAKYVDNTSIGERGYAYIIDDKDNIVYHPQQQLIYLDLKQENIPHGLVDKGVRVDGETIMAKSNVEKAQWSIIGVSNIEDLMAVQRNEVLTFLLVLLAIGGAVSITVGVIMSRGLTRPINSLIASMKEFEKSVETYKKTDVGGFLEVEALSNSFDHMTKQILLLLERVKAEEKELRKVELKALQAQINPHFLYNTLDSILWMCDKKENYEAVEMVSALSKLFRISISRGNDFITLEQELKHVESYLIIQTIRYKNQFTYEIDVDEDILQCKTLKIILQPFVENAIYHGIDRMVDEGLIKITGSRVDDMIVLKVIDNGLGMSQEQADELFVENSERAGVGVKNVHNRLQIYFGDNYGVSIKSELDEGTEIEIKIPYMVENEK